ncbi:MAG: STAS domain-containing protein [Acidimicrobiales bacterium]
MGRGEPLSIRSVPIEGGVRLVFVGEIDLATGDGLRWSLETAIAENERVEVDLSEVTFLDSFGLRVLVSTHGVVPPGNGAFHIVAASPQVKRTFSVTGLDLAYQWPSERH